MSLVWHIFKKDVRVIRGPWLAWVGLQVAALIAAGMAERYAWTDPYDNTEVAYRVASMGLAFLVWVFAYLLIPLALHDDPVSGPSTAWPLRPVSPLQLLAAKAIGVTLFFVLTPLLVRLPWWLLHGYGPGSIARAAIETIAITVVLAVPSVWLASVTADASRFYRWSLMGFGSMVVFYLVWIRLWFANSRGQDLSLSAPNLGLLLPLLLGSTIDQFWNRRTRRSLGTVGAGLAVILLIPARPGNDLAALPLRGAVVTVNQAGILNLVASAPTAPGVSDGWIVDDFARDGRRVAVAEPSAQQQMQALAASHLAQRLDTHGSTRVAVRLPGQPIEEATSPLNVRGRVVRLGEPLAIPLRVGGAVSLGTSRVRVDHILTDSLGARHIVAITETSSAKPRLFIGLRDEPSYFVVRPTGIEAVPASPPTAFMAASVTVKKRILSIPTDDPREEIGELRLMRVVSEPIGRFETDLRAATSSATSP